MADPKISPRAAVYAAAKLRGDTPAQPAAAGVREPDGDEGGGHQCGDDCPMAKQLRAKGLID